jgi:hypothetical protein
MISAAKLAANRANAKRSTGPRTAAGKRRSSQNARRHGLSGPLSPAAEWTIAEFARMVAHPQPHLQALATQVAVAQHALDRARKARDDLLSRAEAGETSPDHIWRLEAIDNYERRARTRRKIAMFMLDAAARLCSDPPRIVRDWMNARDTKATGWKNEPTDGKPQNGKTNPPLMSL